jgi:HPt (histidine-containing phosphotransfer) domain-containing protein
VDRFDLSVLRSLVHELKGVVGYFGLSDLCREVTGFEQAIDCGADPMELTRRFQRIDELVEEMAAAEPETAS